MNHHNGLSPDALKQIGNLVKKLSAIQVEIKEQFCWTPRRNLTAKKLRPNTAVIVLTH